LLYATLCLIVCTGALLLLMIFAADRFGCGCNNQQLKDIMATQKEIAADIAALTQSVKDIGTTVDTAVVEINKVGAETDKSLQLIKDLQDALANQTNASPELVDAVAALTTQVGTLSTSVGAAKAAVQAVDDKVPDAPPTT
jgi:peptidoglycan hydrolase CwlO-like protein